MLTWWYKRQPSASTWSGTKIAQHLLLWVGFLVLWAPMAQAVTPLSITDVQAVLPLSAQAQYLRDPDCHLTIGQVMGPAMATHWRPNLNDSIRFGFTEDCFWLRFDLRNQSGVEEWLLDSHEAWFTLIDLYQQDAQGTWVMTPNGLRVPLAQRSYSGRLAVFPIHLPHNTPTVLILNMQSAGSVFLAPYLTPPQKFLQQVFWETIFDGAYTGLVLGLVVYNLFLCVSLKDKNYLLYVLYAAPFAAFGLLLLGSYNGMLSWGLSREQVLWIEKILLLLGSVSILFLVQFFRRFLNTKLTIPRVDLGIRVGQGLWVFMMVAVLVFPVMWVVQKFDYAMVATYVGGVWLAGWFWYWGNGSARFLFIAMFPEMLGIVIVGAAYDGRITITPWVVRAGLWGSALQMVMFSMALASRYQQMRQEKEVAMQRALDQESLATNRQKENEDLLREIALRRQVERDLLVAKDRAEAATNLKDKFVSLVAHDIRSPLSGLLAIHRMMLADEAQPLPPQHQEWVETALSKTSQFLQSMEDLLNLNRLQTGQLVPQKTRFDLWEVAEEVLMDKTLALAKGITLQQEVPPHSYCYGDRALLTSVVRNLVENAIKFCRSGDRIRITLPPGQPHCFAVVDTGPGIDLQQLPHLFSALIKTSTLGSQGERGSGLGLPLCHEIVLAHGGRLTVESQPNQGTTFLVCLPSQT